MELKDQILQYFDQNPESVPEDFITLYPDIALSTVNSYWILWKKMAAWRYSQGLEDENIAKKAPVGKKRKELLKEQKLPQSGLGLSHSQIQNEVELVPRKKSDDAHSLSIRDFRQSELIEYLIKNREFLVRLIEQAKFQNMREPALNLTESVDEEITRLFDESCTKVGLTRNQGLNIALRDFIQKITEK